MPKASAGTVSPGRVRARKKAALEIYQTCGTLGGTAKALGLTRDAIHYWRKTDAEFALAWQAITETVTDKLEHAALAVALEGDTAMLKFLLATRRPEDFERKQLAAEQLATQPQVIIRLEQQPLPNHDGTSVIDQPPVRIALPPQTNPREKARDLIGDQSAE